MHSAKTTLLKLCIILLGICGLYSTCEGLPPAKELQQDAAREMKAGNWEKAHQLLLIQINRFGERHYQNIDPRTSWFWYHRGYCEIKLGLFDDAANSFEKCYTKFKNIKLPGNQPRPSNRYNKKALLMWGHAAKGAGKWATSIRMYKKFLAERDPTRDGYEPRFLQLNMAINHFKLRKLTEGDQHLQVAIHSKAPTSTEEVTLQIASNIEQVIVLKGNLQEEFEDWNGAEQSYLKALDLSKENGNKMVAGQCLFHLISLAEKEKSPRSIEAVSYYDKFWESYGNDSQFSAKVAVAGIPAMRKAGRSDEALKRLQAVIAEISSKPEAPGLEEAIGSYTDEYLKGHTATELKEHFYSLPGDDTRNMTPRAVIRMAIIRAYEKELESNDPAKIEDAQAIIRVLFEELRSDFRPKDLPNYILIRVGDFIRTSTDAPESSETYYQELLERSSDQTHRFAALLSFAKVRNQGNQAQKNEAIHHLQEVIDDSADTSEQEEARHLLTSIYFENGEYGQAITSSRDYLKNPEFRQHRTHIRMLLASAYEKSDRIDDAISAYQQVWISSNSRPTSKYVATAILRWMELLWKRNQNANAKSDRQIAYEGGLKFLTMTAGAIEKAGPEHKEAWAKLSRLVATYEASPDTTKIEAEEEQD